MRRAAAWVGVLLCAAVSSSCEPTGQVLLRQGSYQIRRLPAPNSEWSNAGNLFALEIHYPGPREIAEVVCENWVDGKFDSSEVVFSFTFGGVDTRQRPDGGRDYFDSDAFTHTAEIIQLAVHPLGDIDGADLPADTVVSGYYHPPQDYARAIVRKMILMKAVQGRGASGSSADTSEKVLDWVRLDDSKEFVICAYQADDDDDATCSMTPQSETIPKQGITSKLILRFRSSGD